MNDFSLIETMRYEPGVGIIRLRLHMARLTRSAARLGFPGAEEAQRTLSGALDETTATPLRVRLTLDPHGKANVTTAPFAPPPASTVWKVRIATARLDSRNTLLRYKTTRRDIYEAARAEYAQDDADEILLLNEKDEPCEGTITSLFLDDGSGQLKTPPISCGLLAGVLRTELICQRRARIQRLTLEDLQHGAVFMGNSLRGLIPVQLVPTN